MFGKKIAILVFLSLITISSFLLPDFGFNKKSRNYKSKPPIALQEEEGAEAPPQAPIDNYVILLFFSGSLLGGFFLLKKTKIQ